MNKSKIDKFSDYPFEMYWSPLYYKDLFIRNIDFLHTKPLYILSLVTLLLLSFFKLHALSLFVGLLGVYLYIHFSMKKIKYGIKVKRDYVKKSKEERFERARYSISNPYKQDFTNLILSDQFEGHLGRNNQTLYNYYFEKLERNKRKRLFKKLSLNNGMGIKRFGPLIVQFTDPLGLNRFLFEETGDDLMEVYPKVYPMNAPGVSAFDQSVEFGVFDSMKRGENVNFYSTREYIEGDSIKKINWKLSLKTQKLIVNEFENNTNAMIEVILINDKRLHTGLGKFSSFEYCRDMILSLCEANLRSHNSIGFHSLDKTIKQSSGKNHFNALELQLSKLELKSFNHQNLYGRKNAQPTEVKEFSKKIKNTIIKGSHCFIFTGLVPGKVWDNYLQTIELLSGHCREVHLVIVNGINHSIKNASDDEQIWLNQILKMIPAELERTKEFCKKKAIHLYINEIKNKNDYQEVIKNVFQ